MVTRSECLGSKTAGGSAEREDETKSETLLCFGAVGRSTAEIPRSMIAGRKRSGIRQ
ncbi:hypothetical protein X742_32555 [Mesorhizobium sp. LNHC232B00]|nr:hypothetical protein X742_32555 [Mesorhizobium sp. LNHC232B00]